MKNKNQKINFTELYKTQSWVKGIQAVCLFFSIEWPLSFPRGDNDGENALMTFKKILLQNHWSINIGIKYPQVKETQVCLIEETRIIHGGIITT